jgi:conjugative relaxase-like TrwC/TraI family protein
VISIDKVVSVDYYVEQVARDRHDYLSGGGEAAGVWDGAFADQLDLHGEVSEDGFRALLAEQHPTTGVQLKPQRNKKVAGWDLTFSPPKSISALWAIAPDDVAAEVRAADEVAGRVGLAFVERHACVARLGRDGVDRQPGTGFAAASFVHRTSREGDPQLHAHRVIANVVQAADGRRAALDGALLWPWRFAADQVYLAALRAELTARLGVRWTERNGVWEIDGIPPALCRAWSKRRVQIEQAMAERGTSGGRAAQAAALATRNPKVGEEGPRTLRERLRQEACEVGIDVEAVLDHVLDRHRLMRAETRAERTVGLCDEEIVERLVGPEGLTGQASGFARRDVYKAAGALVVADQPDALAAAARIDGLVDRVLADPRVVALVEPARKTSGEVIRPRTPDGRVVKEVCTQHERRYTTVSLLAAERELIDRALARQNSGTAVVPAPLVEEAIAAYNTANPDCRLDGDQEAMVRHLCASGNGVDVVVGKAGTGKSTALRVAREAFEAAGIPVVGVAPTANAARQLHQSAGIESGTVDRLLIEVAHGIRRLPAGAVVVLDEAGMCSTRNRLALQQAVDEVGGKVADVGDHRQIPSVDVGGGHAVLARELGAITLGTDHRFKVAKLRDAAELIRDGDAEQGVALLDELGMLTQAGHPHQVWEAMVDDWLALRDQGQSVRMLASENSAVDRLNALARERLVERGEVARRGREYPSADDSREFFVAIGDRVRLGRNSLVGQPDKSITTVRNGMEGTVTRTARRALVVQLDDEHAEDGQAEVELPGWYVGEHVDYAYAVTADKAQGITVDHSLFTPSAATSQERAYVALSRGRHSNRLYATAGSGWQEAIATPRGHVFATEQSPDIDDDLAARILRMRDNTIDSERARARERERENSRQRETGRAIGM